MTTSTTNVKDNLFINFVSEKMLHRQSNKKDGREFYSVSVSCAESVNGYGTFPITTKQLFDSTKNKGTEIVAGFKNILLGKPEKTRKVSVQTGIDAEGKPVYSDIEMSNKQIFDAFEAEREAYKAAHSVTMPADAVEMPAE